MGSEKEPLTWTVEEAIVKYGAEGVGGFERRSLFVK